MGGIQTGIGDLYRIGAIYPSSDTTTHFGRDCDHIGDPL